MSNMALITWREFWLTLIIFSFVMSKFDGFPTFRDDDTIMRRYRVILFWTLLVLLVFMLFMLLSSSAKGALTSRKTNGRPNPNPSRALQT